MSAEERSVGELIVEVSDKTTLLVREEIELAKAEISEKVNQLIRGSVVGIAAGVFLLAFVAMLMNGIAWLITDLFFDGHPWVGFMIEAFFWLAMAGVAGYLAYRSFQKGAPPVPKMAIEEARLTRETFAGSETREAFAGSETPTPGGTA